jgi:hypothetical protein
VPLTLEARLRLTTDIGRYFRRFGMEAEVAQLRAYYRHLREVMNPTPQAVVPSDDTVDFYAAVLKLHPFEATYDVRTEKAVCSCGAPRWRLEEKSWPDRDLMTCRDCKASWLVMATIRRR